MLLDVLRDSLLPILGLTFMHLLLISWILEFIFYTSSLVSTFFFSWRMDEEKGFKESLVVKLSLVLAGLILIWLTLVGERLGVGSETRYFIYESIRQGNKFIM